MVLAENNLKLDRFAIAGVGRHEFEMKSMRRSKLRHYKFGR
jgi:hypothetical protein